MERRAAKRTRTIGFWRGRSSLPAFPVLICRSVHGTKRAKRHGVSPRTDWPAMIRGTASHGRLPVPPVPPHHRPRPAPFLPPVGRLLSGGVRYGWLGYPTTVFCAVAGYNDTRQKLSMLPHIGFHACISCTRRSSVPLPGCWCFFDCLCLLPRT